MDSTELTKLKAPFRPEEIEWRPQPGGNGMKKDGKPWAKVMAYVSARAIHDRLDAVCGEGNWKNEIKPISILSSKEGVTTESSGFLHGISIKVEEEWVAKWDGSECTDFEAFKGGISSSLKRAAVLWGIGRYLYDLPVGWAQFDQDGEHSVKIDNVWYKWNPPALPAWALPDGTPTPKETREAKTHEEDWQDESFRDEPEPQPKNVSTGNFKEAQAATVPSNGWRTLIFPFGKNKDVPLGKFSLDDLAYWCKNYTPKPFKGSISAKDKALRAALDAAQEEMAKKEAQAPQTAEEKEFTHEDEPNPFKQDEPKQVDGNLLITSIHQRLIAIKKDETWILNILKKKKICAPAIETISDLSDVLLERIDKGWNWFASQVDKGEGL